MYETHTRTHSRFVKSDDCGVREGSPYESFADIPVRRLPEILPPCVYRRGKRKTLHFPMVLFIVFHRTHTHAQRFSSRPPCFGLPVLLIARSSPVKIRLIFPNTSAIRCVYIIHLILPHELYRIFFWPRKYTASFVEKNGKSKGIPNDANIIHNTS